MGIFLWIAVLFVIPVNFCVSHCAADSSFESNINSIESKFAFSSVPFQPTATNLWRRRSYHCHIRAR